MVKKMIGTEFFYGQGFGNQLFCYVTAKCIAIDNNCRFGNVSQDLFGAPRWNQKGAYFMDIDLGIEAEKKDFCYIYNEKSDRYFMDTCNHDRDIGCDISLYDKDLTKVADNTLLYGNMQSELYFIHHKEEIKKWLKVKQEYDSYEFYKGNLCILNMRGGEYVGIKELYLERDYWLMGMENMRKINPNMAFMIITDDVKTAIKILPGITAFHFNLAKDYVSIKNAKYLLLSNSSFAFFPAFTSETVEIIIAPKYWARHNISNGYWATGQNIYTGWNYQDKQSILFTSEECVSEFENYKEKTSIYEKTNITIAPSKITKYIRKIKKICNF